MNKIFTVLKGGREPERGTKYSSCVDLFAREDCTIGAGETTRVPLGVCLNLENLEKVWNRQITDDCRKSNFDFFLKSHDIQLEIRSSLRDKGLTSGTGVIDLDFKNEFMLIVHNTINIEQVAIFIEVMSERLSLTEAEELCKSMNIPRGYTIKKGDKVAQCTLRSHQGYMFGIDTEEERKGGIGSTGKRG